MADRSKQPVYMKAPFRDKCQKCHGTGWVIEYVYPPGYPEGVLQCGTICTCPAGREVGKNDEHNG